MMKIFVDGDGCPVVHLTIEIAKSYEIDIIVVKNYCHEIYDTYATIITVDPSPDNTDYYIVNKAQKGDIVVTQDYGLSAMALAKHALCINQNGLIISSENINQLLERRHFHRELRRKHKQYTKFKKRTFQANVNFEKNLKYLIQTSKSELAK
jgi:uncharacterized protein YaiI (UPF0178 family)